MGASMHPVVLKPLPGNQKWQSEQDLPHALDHRQCQRDVGLDTEQPPKHDQASLLNSDSGRDKEGCAARGFSDLYVAWKHVLRNAVRPFITMVGMMIPVLFVGGVLTESVFDYPGLGWLLWRSALDQDYPTLSAITLLIGVLTIVGNLAADVANSILDVRVRYE